MHKSFVGARLRRLREERGLKQVELARLLAISPSYLNQIEQNQRPLTMAMMSRLGPLLGADAERLSDDGEARLIRELREALADSEQTDELPLWEIRELAAGFPAMARAYVSLHRRQRDAAERGDALAARLGGEWAGDAPPRMPFEQVRDYFYARHNHIAELDEAAEKLHAAAGLSPRTVHTGLTAWLRRHHGVEVVLHEGDGTARLYDPATRVLRISAGLGETRQAFQMATQLAFLEQKDVIDRISADPRLAGAEAAKLAGIGLANYFAGALLLPYEQFLAAAEAEAYDIERLSNRFGVGFESICHRLSTLQRPDAGGVPFFFIRVDRAGNISKRQSATDFHFSRVGGSCPLWNVYEAFAQPGRILTQLARMPDGRTYLWIARTVGRSGRGYGDPGQSFAIGLGCDARHADRLIYSKGLDLHDPAAAVPIGAGCRICERPGCTQRAFPPVGRAVDADPNRSSPTPYAII